jgi:hypothetical protein
MYRWAFAMPATMKIVTIAIVKIETDRNFLPISRLLFVKPFQHISLYNLIAPASIAAGPPSF